MKFKVKVGLNKERNDLYMKIKPKPSSINEALLLIGSRLSCDKSLVYMYRYIGDFKDDSELVIERKEACETIGLNRYSDFLRISADILKDRDYVAKFATKEIHHMINTYKTNCSNYDKNTILKKELLKALKEFNKIEIDVGFDITKE